MQTPPPDLAARNEAQRFPIAMIVSKLADLIGYTLTAYLGGLRDVRPVKRWIAGEPITEASEKRLRFAYMVVRMLSEREDPKIIQSWLIGLNPELGDRVPLKLMREADLSIVGPEIMGAAQAFYLLG